MTRQARVGRHVLGQQFAELADRGMQINGRRVLQLADLLADFFHNIRMAMADRDGDDAGEAVEIALALLVPQVLHVPFDDQQRIPVIGDQPRRQILLAQRDDLLLRRPGILFGLMVADRQLRASAASRWNVAFHGSCSPSWFAAASSLAIGKGAERNWSDTGAPSPRATAGRASS